MKLGNKLMRKLGYVPYAEYEIVKKQGDKDSELCASLVLECQNQGSIIDKQTDEITKLKDHIDKLVGEVGDLDLRLSNSGAEVERLRKGIDTICSVAEGTLLDL